MFKLEIIGNTPLGKKDDEDTSVSEAVFSTYSEYETDIYMYWDKLVLCLSRRGDISDIYNDIVDIIRQLESKTPRFFMAFLSSSFTTHWDFNRINDELVKIDAKWIDVVYLDKKNSHIKETTTTVSVIDFINEWKSMLKIIRNDLILVGYTNELVGFDFLQQLD